MKVLHSICQQILKTQQWPQDWKRSVFIPIPKKGNAKERSCSVQFSRSVVSDSLRPHESQHARPPCPSPAPGVQTCALPICESATLNMLANLENSAVATGLEKVSFHSNPKERQCQRTLKLLHNCTPLTC